MQLRALFNDRFVSVFLGPAKNSFGLQREQIGLGFRCYSKNISLGRKVFAGEEFGIPVTAELEPHRTAMTRPKKRVIYLRQISKLGRRPPKRACRLQCASGQALSEALPSSIKAAEATAS